MRTGYQEVIQFTRVRVLSEKPFPITWLRVLPGTRSPGYDFSSIRMAYRSAEPENSGFTSNYSTFRREVVLPIKQAADLPAHRKRSTEEYIRFQGISA